MALDTRELFARLIQCEAGGEGTAGMQAVATVIMNRATTTVGEFARVNNGGDVRAIITQPGQFVCMRETVGGRYNPVFRRSTRKLPTFTFFSSTDVAYYMPCYP